MDIEQLRKICLALPGATEQVQWEDALVFKVGGKMFAVTHLEPARIWLTLKADPQEFADLTERPGIIPAPYLARAKWIAIESSDALPQSEVTALVRKSYDLVLEKLPRNARASLSSRKSPVAKRAKRPKRKRR